MLSAVLRCTVRGVSDAPRPPYYMENNIGTDGAPNIAGIENTLNRDEVEL